MAVDAPYEVPAPARAAVRHAPPGHPPGDVAEMLRPEVEAHRDAAERDGRLPRPIVDALRASAALRLWTPRSAGGFEAPLAVGLEVLREIAALDGATAWVAYNANQGPFAAVLDPAAVAEVWAVADPVVVNSTRSGGTRLRADGDGWRVDGRWDLVTGALAADWACLFASTADREVRVVVVPRDDLLVLETWDAEGLRGSGSDSIVLDDVAVPAHRVHDPATPPRVDGALFRTPLFSVLSAGTAAVVIGIAEAALDELVRVVARRPPDAHAEAEVGRLDCALRAARLLLTAGAADLDATAAAGGAASPSQRARLRGAMTLAATTAREVVVAAHALAGSAVLRRGERLSQLVRDVLAATQHANLAQAHFGLPGRARLGRVPAEGPF